MSRFFVPRMDHELFFYLFLKYSYERMKTPNERVNPMINGWKNLACILLLTLMGCSGKVASWLEQPINFEERIQEIREARTTYEPIVPSNVEQRIQWSEDRRKKYHKWRQLFNPEYDDYTASCLTGDTLTLFLKQEKQMRRERVNRPNKRRSR